MESEIEEDDEEAVTEEASEYEPSESDGDDSCGEGVEDVGETDPATLKKYFIVQGQSLMTLFRFCPQCRHRIRKAQLKAIGTAATVRFACEGCTVTPKRWESQDRAVAHSRERMLRGNVVAAVAAITTGVRYVELSRWADQMNLAMFSKTFFWKIFVWTKPAIESVYRSQQRMVLDMVKREYREGEGLHLAADGAYDSRGYSAMIGKVLVSDARTKLVLHTEVLHRSETENISTRMEVEGLKRLMRWVGGCGLRVASVTTDRSRALGATLRELEPQLGVIHHYYDGWHLVKWLGNELRKAAKTRNCEEIGVWTEKVKTHLWAAIHSGVESGEDVRALFNTCLMHVTGVHQWPLGELTGRFTSCSHGSLPGPRPQDLSADSEAYRKFRDIILTKSFQRDLVKASTYGGTSICEAKNALDRIYCRKEIFYPIATYPLYAMMATLHINTLQLAEISGERKVLKTREVQRKYLDRKSKQALKSPAKHLWRDLVLDEVLNGRLIALQAKYQSGVPQWVVDLMDAEAECECEL